MSIQMKVDVTNTITKSLKNIQQKLNNLPQEAYKEFVDLKK